MDYWRRSWASDRTFVEFFSIYIRKNSHPFWVTECLNFVNRLKMEKIIKIWNCDLTGGSPCMNRNEHQLNLNAVRRDQRRRFFKIAHRYVFLCKQSRLPEPSSAVYPLFPLPPSIIVDHPHRTNDWAIPLLLHYADSTTLSMTYISLSLIQYFRLSTMKVKETGLRALLRALLVRIARNW